MKAAKSSKTVVWYLFRPPE